MRRSNGRSGRACAIVLVHQYFRIDQQRIWRIIERDLPPLERVASRSCSARASDWSESKPVVPRPAHGLGAKAWSTTWSGWPVS